RARLRGRRAARSRRRHGGEPALLAPHLGAAVLPHWRSLDPRPLPRRLARRRPAPLPPAAGLAARVRGRSLRPLPSSRVKILLVTMYFPPAGGGGVQRPLKFATHLPAYGIETHVLAP